MKNVRKGLGKGLGSGYYNIAPMDSHIHSLSAKGVKSAQQIFKEANPDGGKNFMTPQILRLGKAKENRAYELSTGEPFLGENLYGVTVIDDVDGIKKRHDLSKVFQSKEKAEEYIKTLSNLRAKGRKGFTWNKTGNMSLYVGYHTSFWLMDTGRNIHSKDKSIVQPISYIIAVNGQKGNKEESGHYTISWGKGFRKEPNPLFHRTISPAFDIATIGKYYTLKKDFDGRLGEVDMVRDLIAGMISKTGKLPTPAQVTKKILKNKKKFGRGYTLSNWIYEIKKGE